MAINKQAIFSKKMKTEELQIEEWEGSVFVRGMNAHELQDFLSGKRRSDLEDAEISDGLKQTIQLVIRCTYDENGKRVFEDADYEALSQQPITPLNLISEKVLELSGFGNKEKN